MVENREDLNYWRVFKCLTRKIFMIVNFQLHRRHHCCWSFNFRHWEYMVKWQLAFRSTFWALRTLPFFNAPVHICMYVCCYRQSGWPGKWSEYLYDPRPEMFKVDHHLREIVFFATYHNDMHGDVFKRLEKIISLNNILSVVC